MSGSFASFTAHNATNTFNNMHIVSTAIFQENSFILDTSFSISTFSDLCIFSWQIFETPSMMSCLDISSVQCLQTPPLSVVFWSNQHNLHDPHNTIQFVCLSQNQLAPISPILCSLAVTTMYLPILYLPIQLILTELTETKH